MSKFYKSELTVSSDTSTGKRNILGVLLSILVLIIISSMIVASIVLINPEIVDLSSKLYAPREPISMQEAFMDELGPNNFVFQWLSSSTSNSDKNMLEAGQSPSEDVLVYEDQKNLKMITLGSVASSNSNMSSFNVDGPPSSSSTGTDAFPHLQGVQPATIITNTSLLSSVEYQGFRLSPSRKYLLIWNSKKRQFRHSFTAKYYLYDLQQDLISLLSTKQQPATEATGSEEQRHNSYEKLDSAAHYLNGQSDEDEQASRFQLVQWFDNDSLVLVQNNDLYVLPNVADETQKSGGQQPSPIRLTKTGKFNEIYNGVPDWLYEEEILGDALAFQISPGKGSTLAYMSFNDSQVELMPYTVYGPPDQVIPRTQSIRYPKAGRVNPSVDVHVIDDFTSSDPSKRVHLKILLPDELGQRQHYINRIKWLTSDHLALIWLNRHQNESHILICTRQQQWLCQKNLHLQAPGGWLELGDDLYPLDSRTYLAMVLKDEGAKVGSFKHIARVSLSRPNTFTYLTGGKREVLSLEGVDRRLNLIYYTATPEGEPGQRQLYSLQLDSAQPGDPPHCITCDHYDDECLYNYAKMSPSARHYVYQCDGPGVPRTELRSTPSLNPSLTLNKGRISDVRSTQQDQVSPLPSQNNLQHESTTLLWSIEQNLELRNKLNYDRAMPLTMRLKVPIAGTDYSANVLMLLPPQSGSLRASTKWRKQKQQPSLEPSSLPPMRARRQLPASQLDLPLHGHFDEATIGEYISRLSDGQQFPMVVDVYGGPGSQKVDFRFNLNLGHYLASSRRTVYAMIDGRGSANEGTKRLFEMRHRFGQAEIEDQIQVTSHLVRNYSFIHPNKVAIWGWSYGGYAAAMVLAKSNALRPLTPLPANNHYHAHHLHPRLSIEQAAVEGKLAAAITNRTNIDLFGKPTLSVGQPLANNNNNVRRAVFECAVSVAPVTNWLYYDTAYTERYMSSPYLNELYDLMTPGDHNQANQALSDQIFAKLNHQHHREPTNKWLAMNETSTNVELHLKSAAMGPLSELARQSATGFGSRLTSAMDINERYRQASLLDQIQNIDKKRFLLIHGTADDNVHFQQSIMLMKRLIHKNVLFETRLYPDQDHAIGNRADKLHLGSTLSNFFSECFDLAIKG